MSRIAHTALALASILATAGATTSCLGATEPVEVVTWNGTLIASDGVVDGMSGTIAMVIGESVTQLGISVRLAPAGETLGWALREGECAQPGTRVGPADVFPFIDVDNEGDGQAEAVLFRRIATAGPYAVVVYGNGDGTGDVLACGEFEQS